MGHYKIVKYLDTGELIPDPTPSEKIDVCLQHADGLIKIKGEKVAMMEMRKHAAWYLKGMKGNGRVRCKINEIEKREALAEILYTYAEEMEKEHQVS